MKHSNPWTTLGIRVVYSNPWIELTERKVIKPSGDEGQYGVVHFKNHAVGVLAVDEQERVLMVGQWRYALGRYSWELPEGGSGAGETPLKTAHRELREETGYRAKKMKKLFSMHLSNSVTDEVATIFEASGLTPGKAQPEDTEDITVAWVPLRMALQKIEKGEITDAITVATLFHLSSRKKVSAPSARRRSRSSLEVGPKSFAKKIAKPKPSKSKPQKKLQSQLQSGPRTQKTQR